MLNEKKALSIEKKEKEKMIKDINKTRELIGHINACEIVRGKIQKWIISTKKLLEYKENGEYIYNKNNEMNSLLISEYINMAKFMDETYDMYIKKWDKIMPENIAQEKIDLDNINLSNLDKACRQLFSERKILVDMLDRYQLEINKINNKVMECKTKIKYINLDLAMVEKLPGQNAVKKIVKEVFNNHKGEFQNENSKM